MTLGCFQWQANVRVTEFFMLWSPVYMMGLSQPRTSRAQGLKEMKSSKRSTHGVGSAGGGSPCDLSYVYSTAQETVFDFCGRLI